MFFWGWGVTYFAPIFPFGVNLYSVTHKWHANVPCLCLARACLTPEASSVVKTCPKTCFWVLLTFLTAFQLGSSYLQWKEGLSGSCVFLWIELVSGGKIMCDTNDTYNKVFLKWRSGKSVKTRGFKWGLTHNSFLIDNPTVIEILLDFPVIWP